MLRIIFMGTPQFAVPTLAAIIAAGHDVAVVYTQPPRAAGRGMAAKASPVHAHAQAAGIPTFTPTSLRSAEMQAEFAAIGADVAVVVAYGLILPGPILQAPRYGCLNLHASALPRWRGAAPIARAIMAGDTESAATVMRMDQGLDTGPVCLTEPIPIGPDMTAGELHDRMAAVGSELMLRALASLARGELACWPQPAEGVTYASKIDKGEALVDFARPAAEVHNLIRGLSPAPSAWFEAVAEGRRERVKVLRSTLVEGSGSPGTLLDGDLTVACRTGAVRLLEVQKAGGRPMPGTAFLRGFQVPTGRQIARAESR